MRIGDIRDFIVSIVYKTPKSDGVHELTISELNDLGFVDIDISEIDSEIGCTYKIGSISTNYDLDKFKIRQFYIQISNLLPLEAGGYKYSAYFVNIKYDNMEKVACNIRKAKIKNILKKYGNR